MTISIVSLTDTFDEWRTKTNQLIMIGNLATEGQQNTTGTLTITNPTLVNDGVSLNVSNGVIRVGANTFSSNAVEFKSNTTGLVFRNSGRLGTVVYLEVANLSTSIQDTSISNIASANIVNSVLRVASSSFLKANNALANTTGTFAGTLTLTGDLILL